MDRNAQGPGHRRQVFFSGVAKGGGAGGAARPWCHHFGVTPFYDTKQKENNNIVNITENV